MATLAMPQSLNDTLVSLTSTDEKACINATDDDIECVKDFLEIYTSKCNHFGEDPNDEILGILTSCIACKKSLHQLSLRGSTGLLKANKLQDDDMFALSESLVALPHSPFVIIDLSYNNIENNGAKALSSMLKATKSLSSLSLRSNDIGEIGGLAIAYAIKGQSTLISLDLNGNPIGDNGVASIAKSISGQDNTCLRALDIGNTHMSTNAVIQIAQSLATNSTLEYLNMDNALLFSLENETCLHLSKMIAANTSLRSLSLAKHRIRDHGLQWIIEGLLNNTHITHLNLRCNNIGPGGAVDLSHFLQSPSCVIIDLNLAGNRLTDEGGSAIANAITNNQKLRVLDLSYCSLSTPALSALATALSDCSLQKLCLWGNHFLPISAIKLREALLRKNDIDVDFEPLLQLE